MVNPMSDIQIIASGIELPNGSVVPNRLVKVTFTSYAAFNLADS